MRAPVLLLALLLWPLPSASAGFAADAACSVSISPPTQTLTLLVRTVGSRSCQAATLVSEDARHHACAPNVQVGCHTVTLLV